MKLLARIIILVVVFVAGLLVGLAVMQKPAMAPTTTGDILGAALTVELKLDYGEGNIQTYNGIGMKPGQSVFDLLKKVTAENEIEFSYKDYGAGMGAFVESINKVRNDPGKNMFWQYWVNDVFAEVGASNYALNDGDLVEWKYMRAQY